MFIIKTKTGLPNGLATAIRSLYLHFGNPAIPAGPVAFRPTIARGLAFSASIFVIFAFNLILANFMPKNGIIQ
jgi:hypothetical protein